MDTDNSIVAESQCTINQKSTCFKYVYIHEDNLSTTI